MVDFIGLGAQKAGTSWVYACLYEHPEICAPIKEIHFFSRHRFANGQDWYESNFASCEKGKKCGEFSTSYLYDRHSAERIARMYPNARLIAIVRNPINRAYSQYKNAVKAGEIPKHLPFTTYLDQVPSAKEQGLYARQLDRYYQYFSSVQLKVLVYEDAKREPLKFMQEIYKHIGVDPEFVPSMLKRYVNEERTPRFVFIDRWMHRAAELLRKIGLDRVVWLVKRSGVSDSVRKVNTEKPKPKEPLDPALRAALVEYFEADVARLSSQVYRNLTVEWGFKTAPVTAEPQTTKPHEARAT